MSTDVNVSELRHEAVYPGHPAVVALCIMNVFSNLADAEKKSDRTDFASALSHSQVPGAGGNVAAALRLLADAQHKTPEETWAQAEGIWRDQVGPGSGNHEKAFEPGVAQANTLKATFLAQVATWGKPPVVQPRPRRSP